MAMRYGQRYANLKGIFAVSSRTRKAITFLQFPEVDILFFFPATIRSWYSRSDQMQQGIEELLSQLGVVALEQPMMGEQIPKSYFVVEVW
jgi:hypothetical protein